MTEIYDLKCCGLADPLGIDAKKPVFSWKIKSDKNDTYQTAYQICVVDAEGDPVWYSGKQETDQSICIPYGGKELEEKSVYRWSVMVTDNHGSEICSRDASFETAYFDNSNFRGSFIGRQIPEDKVPGPDPDEDLGAILVNMMKGEDISFEPDRKLEQINEFVKTFVIPEDKRIERARIYMTAHGIYLLKVNGIRPDDTLFAPGFTAYPSYLEYQTYDITSLLRVGENEISVALADGWYKGKFGILGIGENYGDELSFLLNADIFYADGTKDEIDSDASFVSKKTPWLYSDIMIGSRYDARLEGEAQPEIPAREVSFSFDNLKAACAEPVRPLKEFQPQLIVSPKGEQILDFGQNISGVVRMKVRGSAGTEIKIEHSEVLDQDGNYINCIDGFNRDQTDFYVLKGEGEEIFQPQFTFHGFRYAKVSGYPGEIDPADFTGIMIGSDCAVTGTFRTSNEKLNQLQSNIQWSQRDNLLSIPTDCPQRERAGWTGDVWVYGETCCYNQDCYNFFRRWLANLREEQFGDGLVPIVIPYIKAYKAIQLQSFGTHTSAGWGDVIIALPWVLYQTYGDPAILEENYEAMEKWMAYVRHEAETGVNLKEGADEAAKARQKYLWNTNFHFGDWLYPSCKNEQGETDMFRSADTTKEEIATLVYVNSTEIMAKVCDTLGRRERAEEYRDLNQNIRAAFAAEYITKDGKLRTELQGLYVMTLAMHIPDEETKPKMAERLRLLIETNGGCLDTGFMSIKFLMDALLDAGLADTANTVLYQEKCPSWLYEVNWGATTIWETWNSIQPDGERLRFSYNHYAFGCVGSFLYRRILGIQSAAPGYKEIVIAPDFRFGLREVSGSFDSVCGTIEVKWTLSEDGTAEIEVHAPANVTAYLALPGQKKERIGNGTAKRRISVTY